MKRIRREGRSRAEARLKSAERRGRFAELAAAAFLMAKGYRIIAWRFKSPAGEIDLIAKRGRRLAFVEVKQRPTIEECQSAVTNETRRRVHAAADLWLARRDRFQTMEFGFDLVFVMPRRWPVHLPNAL